MKQRLWVIIKSMWVTLFINSLYMYLSGLSLKMTKHVAKVSITNEFLPILILTLEYCMTFGLKIYHVLYLFSSLTVVFSIPNVPSLSNNVQLHYSGFTAWAWMISPYLDLPPSSLLPSAFISFHLKDKFHPLFWNPITIIVIIFNKVYPDSFSLIIIITIALSGFTSFVAPVPACSSFTLNCRVRKTSSAWQHCCPESFCNKVNIGPIQKLLLRWKSCYPESFCFFLLCFEAW